MFKIRASLFLKFALFIFVGAGLVLFVMVRVNSYIMHDILLKKQADYYTVLASDAAHEINNTFSKACKVVDEAALIFEYQPTTRENSTALMERIIEHDSFIFGSAIALAPDSDFDASGYQILYSWRIDNEITTVEREAPLKDYQSDWFYLPQYLERPVWCELYADKETDEIMTTYSVPIFKKGKLKAVITCDLTVDHIENFLDTMKIGKNSQPILVSETGRLIIHPNKDWIMTETFYSLAEQSTLEDQKAQLQNISYDIIKSQSGMHRYKSPSADETVWFYFNRIPSTGWAVGFIVPEDEIFAPIVAMNKKMAVIGVLGALLLLIPALLISLTITRPLHEICNATRIIATGDFDLELPQTKRSDEIGQLVSDFDKMRSNLKEYMKNLATTTAEKEKISSELAIAEEIQHSILPKLFPPFPKRAGLDIFAILHSAREVGGDLYDFILLDDNHLYIAIGDVSGKGVPASLFMAVGKTLLKSTIQTVMDPAKALIHVNNELADGNDSCMFITMFCGILNLETNELIYSNAGHNPPLLITKDEPEFLPDAYTPPLAAMEDIEFENQTLMLGDGMQLLLYTDGVTEAMNSQEVLFDESRLVETVKANPTKTAEKRISTVLKAIREFADGAEQYDDITMLCVSNQRHEEYIQHENSPSSTLVLTNRREEFARMVTWLEDVAEDLKWDTSLLMQLNLVLEEWIVNVISYAFPDESVHEIEVRLWHKENNIKIEIIDDGIPFDPTKQDAPDVDAPLEKREIGGLGIHFIKESTDDFTYERKDNHNIVTMHKLTTSAVGSDT
ncbi:MAG: SpoIIE family protein phosphatase [Kiritimatiellae bacterium]|jgi:sigma-B regulation protein RsbU (phosphoserine phosphatase)|nr:SpoIIE family protein phosphatase [Kiritimatiellia bacterium]